VIPDPAELPTVPLWPDAARAWGVGRAKVFELARQGQLPFPAYKLGRSWRVPTAALRRALGLEGDDEP
jgi:excisionase family DNA binding protein